MSDFKKLSTPNLAEQLNSGMNRVSQYQTFQRGVDARSGNIILSDKYGNRRTLIGTLSNGEFVIAISAESIDVFDALGE